MNARKNNIRVPGKISERGVLFFCLFLFSCCVSKRASKEARGRRDRVVKRKISESEGAVREIRVRECARTREESK